jgi:hypothetical protein
MRRLVIYYILLSHPITHYKYIVIWSYLFYYMSLSPSNPLYRIDIACKSHENSDCAPYGLQEPSRDPPAIRTVASAPTSRCSMKCTGHVSRWVAKTAKTSHELKHLRWNYVEPFWDLGNNTHRSMYAIYIYGNIYHQYPSFMLAYIPCMDPSWVYT